MWQVVYVASTDAVAATVKRLLTQGGFLVMLRSAGTPTAGLASAQEVLVPEVEAAEAIVVLAGALSADMRRSRS